MKLQDKTAIVTGSGRGIGRAIALKLASEGARVVVNDLDAEPAKETVAAIESDGGEAVACVGSVTDDDFATVFVQTAVDAFGGVDIVVNNAGYTWDNVIQKMGDDQWDAILDVHLKAPFRILRAVQPVLRDQARRDAEAGTPVVRKVVNISSVAGLGGNPGQANYAAAKAGITGLTKTLAKEWGRYNVVVNTVAFGLISTRLTEASADGGSTIDIAGHQIAVGLNPELLAGAERMIPLGRAGTVEEAAGSVYLLCSPRPTTSAGRPWSAAAAGAPDMRRDLYGPEHEAYRASVAALLERDVVPHFDAWSDAGIVPRELFLRLGELGAFGFDIDEKYGGHGTSDFRFNSILSEEAQAVGVAPALLGPTLQADVVTPYLTELTDDDQKRRWLPGVVTGETITAIAMTEPGTGSDLSGIATRAVREGDHYVVNGAKTFITNGINADLVVTAVRTGDHPHRGLTLLVLERGMAGFERGRKLRKMGLHAQDTAELVFTDVRVPVANRLGEEGAGFVGLTTNLARERLSLAVSSMAGARTALSWTIDHVRGRSVFGSGARVAPAPPDGAGRARHRDRPRHDVRRPLRAGPARRRARPRRRREGQVVVHRAARPGPGPVRAAARRLRLHARVRRRASVGRRAGQPDLWRRDRDHEGDHRPLPRTGTSRLTTDERTASRVRAPAAADPAGQPPPAGHARRAGAVLRARLRLGQHERHRRGSGHGSLGALPALQRQAGAAARGPRRLDGADHPPARRAGRASRGLDHRTSSRSPPSTTRPRCSGSASRCTCPSPSATRCATACAPSAGSSPR